MRLAKFMADAGVASRRKSEDLIREGVVRVNGSYIYDPATNVDPEVDTVYVSGKKITVNTKKIYIMLNKPTGCVSTCQDDKGRQTVLDYVRDIKERIYPIGRLDYNSEGLLLLTNDGELANKLTHPRHEVSKRYYVALDGILGEEDRETLEKGVMLEEGKTAPAHIKIMRAEKGRTELTITIHEGRNRQVRRMFETVGKRVVFLKRISEGDINLGPLKKGRYRHLTEEEVAYLKSIK
ncbi:MAG: rRNA pseudouridine synthase [Clostridia bacterium]|nr:rRNA pseudouridine synthase [Clostridia bacterium]MBR3295326.1 rRNA pseudouridine synthase [Clostridia bacterium]